MRPDGKPEVGEAGRTVAFVVAAVMILGAAVITLTGLSIKHEELATDEPVAVS